MPKSFRTASASWSSCEKEATADRSSLRGVHPRSTLPSAAEFANQAGDVMAKSYLPSSTIRRPSMQAMPGCMRSEEHTSELQSLMRPSYAVFCLQKKKNPYENTTTPLLL